MPFELVFWQNKDAQSFVWCRNISWEMETWIIIHKKCCKLQKVWCKKLNSTTMYIKSVLIYIKTVFTNLFGINYITNQNYKLNYTICKIVAIYTTTVFLILTCLSYMHVYNFNTILGQWILRFFLNCLSGSILKVFHKQQKCFFWE